ncbi:MAG: TonB-dependent receptor [Bacteroidales bacterium]|nr:TonB-dependent receptor [Bacteroidales bacterium]
MKSKLFTCLAALLVSVTLMAQTKVTGVVKDAAGPVIGAAVVEQGTSNGTTTDFDGRFELTVKEGATLEVSSIGYKTAEIKVGTKTYFEVILEEDSLFLDDVVVVGYGTMKRSDLSGASVSMKEEDLRGSIISSLDQTLQGRAAGVTAVQTSGAPGSSSSIRVRGQATVNANAEPLYVIDGVIVQGGGNSGSDFGLGDALGNGRVSTISPLSTINPADIVSMEILKDASATAIYGAQGANGVVLITTKHGKAGDAKFTYDGMVAASRQTSRIQMLNLRQFAEYYNDMVNIGEVEANPLYADPSLLGKGTNWQDEVFRTAFQHQHQVSATGGTDKVQYYVSGSYMNQEGTIIGSQFDRFSVRTNLDAQLKEWFKLGVNAAYSRTHDNLKLADGQEGVIFYSLSSLPDIPVYDIDGNYSTVVREGYNTKNPVALAMYNENLLERQKLNGGIYAELTPIKHFTFRSEVGFDISSSEADTYKPKISLGTFQQGSNQISQQRNGSTYWSWKNYLTYNNTFGKHSVTAMIGQEAWESRWDYLRAASSDLPSDEIHSIGLATSKSPTIGGGFGSSAMASFFTRETYNYDNRYLLTYTFRYDGSSNFGPENRWAGFHSLAGSWRFTNEAFYPAEMKDILSDGKIRIGWGQTGNSNIGSGAWESGMSKMPSALGDSQRPSNISNIFVHWEKQEQTNLGIDLNFLQNRFNLTIDMYQKISRDMLMSMTLPSYMGTQGNGSSALAAPKGNFGSIRNRGLEITLDTHPIDREFFSWDSNFQISFNKNKLIALDGSANAQLVGYGQWNDIVSVTEIGESLYNFYGYKVVGVYKDMDDILNSPTPEKFPEIKKDEAGNDYYAFDRNTTVWPGDLKFEDVNKDGKINELDRTNIGSPLPKFTFGWTNTFRFGNFDLSVFLNGSYGNKVLNYNLLGQGWNGLVHMNSVWYNQHISITDRARLEVIDPEKEYKAGESWQWDVTNVRVSNPNTKTPRPTIADPNDNDRLSDRYVEDGSYIRVKNITLGYTLPKSMLEKIHFDNVRVYMNIQNLYTLTRYQGFDPEVGASTQDSTGLTFGVDNGRYPSPMTCSFGVNLTF